MTRCTVSYLRFLAVFAVIISLGGDVRAERAARPKSKGTEIGVGYQGTVYVLPTLGLVDDLVSNIDFHAFSVRMWGPRRLGGEFDLALAELEVGRKGGDHSRLLVGSAFGKLLYSLSHRGNSRLYAGLQLAIPFVNARDESSSSSGRRRDDASVFSGGLLVGTEAKLGADSPLSVNAEVGYNVLNVDTGSDEGTLEGIFLSGGLHYYF